MTKTDLIKAISEQSGFAHKDTHTFLDAFIEVTTEALKRGDDVQLVGFGSFTVTKRSARMGMDFRTKKPVEIAASNGVKFKVGKTLKEAVNS